MITPEERATLQQGLQTHLDKASRHFKIFRILRAISYVLILMLCVLFWVPSMAFLRSDDSLQTDVWDQNRLLTYVIPLFIGIFVSFVLFNYFYRKSQESDHIAVQRIMQRLFPKVQVTIGSCKVKEEYIVKSKLFDFDSQEGRFAPSSYGCIRFSGDTPMRVDDLMVPMSRQMNKLMAYGIGQYLFIFKTLYTSIFTSRVDIAGQFRGLYMQTKIDMPISLDLILLPDKSEAKLESVATMIQSLSKREGLHFVHLEDVSFEKHFKVYTSDDINARYILTPLMMSRIVALYESFGRRDLFMSFCGDILSVAVSIPEGTFSAVRSSVDPKLIDNLYDSIMGFRNIPQYLQLKN